MNQPHRRYEMLLPLKFNDGRPVPRELVAQTLADLQQRFGPVSCETQEIRGLWPQHGRVEQDDLIRAFVDVPDLPEHREFFVAFKERLKQRFQQQDIWITTHALEVL